MTCATPGFTRAPSQPAQDQPSPPEQKPRLFNKRIILWGAEKSCRNVVAVRYDRRARRAERVGRSFVGIGVRMQLRRTRPRSPDAKKRNRDNFVARRKVISERFQREVNGTGSTHGSRSSRFYPNRRYCGPRRPEMYVSDARRKHIYKTSRVWYAGPPDSNFIFGFNPPEKPDPSTRSS